MWLYRQFFGIPLFSILQTKHLKFPLLPGVTGIPLAHKFLTLGTEQRVLNTRERRHWKIFSIGATVFSAVGKVSSFSSSPPSPLIFAGESNLKKTIGKFNLINSEIKYSSISKIKYSAFGLPAIHLTFSSPDKLWWQKLDRSSNFADVFNYRGAKRSVGFYNLKQISGTLQPFGHNKQKRKSCCYGIHYPERRNIFTCVCWPLTDDLICLSCLSILTALSCLSCSPFLLDPPCSTRSRTECKSVSYTSKLNLLHLKCQLTGFSIAQGTREES